MASSSITSWQIDRKKMETVKDFICLGSKITVDGDYSHEIKHLLLGRKAVTNIVCTSVMSNSLLPCGLQPTRQTQTVFRDITLPTKVCIGKATAFLGVMYGYQSWTIKKAECQRTDAYKICWRRLLRVPWTARRSNQSILKENNAEYSLEGLMLKLKLKLQFFGFLVGRAN